MMKRALTTTGLAAVLALSLTGCFGGGTTTTTEEPPAPVETEETTTPTDDGEGTEINGELLGEVTRADGLKFEIYSVGETTTTEDSGYQFEDGSDGYPAGTTVELLVYKITNTSDVDIDVYGISTATSKYYDSGYYAYTDFDAETALESDGYASDLYDIYGFDAETWPLAPGDSVTFGEGWYHDAERDGDLTIEFDTADNDDEAEVVVKFE